MGMLGALLAQLPPEQAWFYATTAAAAQALDPALLMAVMETESSFDPLATHLDRDGISSYGLMQLRPETAAILAGRSLTVDELLDPFTNTLLGAKYLADNLRRAGDRLPDALAAYNAGTARKNAAGQYVNSRGDTGVQRYVDRVLAAYARWGGTAGLVRATGGGADIELTVTAATGRPPTPARGPDWAALFRDPLVLGLLGLFGAGLVLTVTTSR